MSIRKIFTAIDISASGLRVQRQRMNAIASNLANIETTKTKDGEPYRRKVVALQPGQPGRTFQQELQRVDPRLHVSNPRHIRGSRFTRTEREVGVPVIAKTSAVQDGAFRLVYDPEHPDSDANGYVRLPNINVITEMVDMIAASRSYEANATAIDANKTMAKKSLEI